MYDLAFVVCHSGLLSGTAGFTDLVFKKEVHTSWYVKCPVSIIDQKTLYILLTAVVTALSNKPDSIFCFSKREKN